MTITIRDLLNRARWRDGDLHSLSISVVHRGAPGDRRVVSGGRIASVGASGIEVDEPLDAALGSALDGVADEEPTHFIPYHRFLEIAGSGGVLWDKDAGMRPAPHRGRHEEDAADVASPPRRAAAEEGTAVRSPVGRVVSSQSGSALVIDGSAGEGGGQILRTSLALSVLTGAPFVLENIRAGRKKPGLMRQHLTSVRACAVISGAELEGATLGSTRLSFRPGPVRGGEHTLDIGSAGSVSLVLQTLALPLALGDAPSVVTVRGGTHARWAPPHPFLEEAWLPLVQRMGADLRLELRGVGFYPAGGGEVLMTTAPSGPLAPLHLEPRDVEQDGPLDVSMTAIVSGLPEGIARRELSVAAAALTSGVAPRLRSETVRSPGPGNAIWLTAVNRRTGLTNVFSAIGEQGVRAEEVGATVAADFERWLASKASVEEHLTDQLMLPIALAGEGSFTCDRLTLHAFTNLEVIAAFTGRRFEIRQLEEQLFVVSLGG